MIAKVSRASLARQGLAHGAVALLLVCTLLLANSRAAAGHTGFGLYLAAAWGFFCGLALSHIVHEWCHFAGALISKSRVTIKTGLHPLFFDFDLAANTHRQFLWLGAGGLLGNILLLSTAALLVGQDTLVLTSLLAAVAGQLVFVLVLELPVSLAVRAGKDPLEALTAHFGQGGPLFLRAAIAGVATAAIVFLVY